MKKLLNFSYPFAGYTDLDFINCFASTYMYLENISGVDEYDCSSRVGKHCNSCGNCNNSTSKKQEDLFFFFGTMSGCNAQRLSFDGEENEMQKSLENIDSVIEFVMGLTGYEYTMLTDNFNQAIMTSIHGDKPVLARMKDGSRGSFRVIIGYDENDIICADPNGAQRKPDCNPSYNEIESLYVITSKTKPKYGLKDGFLRIEKVMDYNRDMGLWDGYIRKFYYWDEKLADTEFDELKHRFKRVSDTMWYTFNCHNFAETFRHRVWNGMKDERFDNAFDVISKAYDLTHTRAWQVIALNDCRDWSSRRYNELEWGMFTCVLMCLESIKHNDDKVFAAIKEAIQELSE